MNQISLHQNHIELGAKMVPFAGFIMPVSYKGIKVEHNAVRNSVGVFDVSHMGEFLVDGPQALDLIQYITSNDASALTIGKVQYSCFPNGEGGIVDDLLVYMIAEDQYLLVVNASNMDKDFEWIEKNNSFDATLTDISDDTALFAVQGPKAIEAMQSLTSENLSEMPYYSFAVNTFAGVEGCIISATGYTGAGGFEIYVSEDDAEVVFNAILEAGKEFGIEPCGLGCRDTLRLEMGYCLYGNDIDDTTSPLEAGLGWITKFTKDFIDKDFLLNQKAEGIKRKLVGFEMMEKGIPRHDYEIFDENGEKLGKVTSGSESITTNKFIGMGYVATTHSKIGTSIFIDIRGKKMEAKIVKLPIISK